MPPIIPTTEPYFFHGSAITCSLVHGFTGALNEMRWIGEYLASQGHSVLEVHLAGRTTQPADLICIHWQDWLASVEDGYYLIKHDYAQLVVCRLSHHMTQVPGLTR